MIFHKTQIPQDFEDNIYNFVTQKGYDANEIRLFKSMLKDSLDLFVLNVLMRHFYECSFEN